MAKRTEKDVQEEIRMNLESMLGDDMRPSVPPVVSGDDSLGERLSHPNTQPMDLHEVRGEAERDARRTLKSLIDFYLGAKMIQKNDYAKFKRRVDEMSLSNMMFAMRAAQLAVIKLLEEIDMGNTHPRNFEALVALNGQMMNMIKHQQALFVTMEEGYKRIKLDQQASEQDNTEEAEAEDVTFSGVIKARGTRLLMQNLRKNVSPVTDDNPDRIKLTDARNRPENKASGPIKAHKDAPDDEIYGELDEHF